MFVVTFLEKHEGDALRYQAVVSKALRRGRERIESDPKLALKPFTISVRTDEQGVLFRVTHVPASCGVH